VGLLQCFVAPLRPRMLRQHTVSARGEALSFYTKGVVEGRTVILPRDRGRQLDQSAIVDITPEGRVQVVAQSAAVGGRLDALVMRFTVPSHRDRRGVR